MSLTLASVATAITVLVALFLWRGQTRGAMSGDTVDVAAASSLKPALNAVARAYEARHPGSRVRLVYTASDRISRQIRAGLRADVVATADLAQMRKLTEAGAVGAPASFAGNRLVIAVSRSSGATVREAIDLAGQLRLAIGSSSVPVGRYANQAVSRLAERYGAAYSSAVFRNVVTRGQSASDVIAPVALGGVDASISYATDARAAGRRVRVVAVPQFAQPEISYWVAAARTSNAGARRFIEMLRSATGRAALRATGFTAAPVATR